MGFYIVSGSETGFVYNLLNIDQKSGVLGKSALIKEKASNISLNNLNTIIHNKRFEYHFHRQIRPST